MFVSTTSLAEHSWRGLHQSSILLHMRTPLNLDDELVRQAREFSGIQEKTALIHAALRELISRAAARPLAAFGGTMPNFQAGPPRRSIEIQWPLAIPPPGAITSVSPNTRLCNNSQS